MEQNSQDILVEQTKNALAEKLAHLPALPGVYLMKGKVKGGERGERG
jgi:hypothetical protein